MNLLGCSKLGGSLIPICSGTSQRERKQPLILNDHVQIHQKGGSDPIFSQINSFHEPSFTPQLECTNGSSGNVVRVTRQVHSKHTGSLFFFRARGKAREVGSRNDGCPFGFPSKQFLWLLKFNQTNSTKPIQPTFQRGWFDHPTTGSPLPTTRHHPPQPPQPPRAVKGASALLAASQPSSPCAGFAQASVHGP